MAIVIDAHCDSFLWHFAQNHKISLPVLPDESHVSGELMRTGGVNLEVFSIFLHNSMLENAENLARQIISESKDLLLKNGIRQISQAKDLLKIRKGMVCGVLGLEGAIPLGNNANMLADFYDLGLRVLTMTWSRKNSFCSGVGFEGGLTKAGKELLSFAEELGIVIDVSHLNSEGFNDIIDLCNKPFIASHSCAYSITPHPRNLTDNQIKEIAQVHGVIGVNFYPGFLTNNKWATIQNVVDHIIHISEIGGTNCVGLGSDYDGITSTPEGLEDVSCIRNIPLILETEGFSTREIEGIMGENFKRVFLEVWN
jgi:membrane dipeptidase